MPDATTTTTTRNSFSTLCNSHPIFPTTIDAPSPQHRTTKHDHVRACCISIVADTAHVGPTDPIDSGSPVVLQRPNTPSDDSDCQQATNQQQQQQDHAFGPALRLGPGQLRYTTGLFYSPWSVESRDSTETRRNDDGPQRGLVTLSRYVQVRGAVVLRAVSFRPCRSAPPYSCSQGNLPIGISCLGRNQERDKQPTHTSSATTTTTVEAGKELPLSLSLLTALMATRHTNREKGGYSWKQAEGSFFPRWDANPCRQSIHIHTCTLCCICMHTVYSTSSSSSPTSTALRTLTSNVRRPHCDSICNNK